MSLNEKLKRLVDKDYFAIWGICASIIMLICFLSPIIGYRGAEGESYSLLNHMVSELGKYGVSHLALLFNLGLIIGGITYIPFIIGLGSYLNNKFSKVARVVGTISLVCCILVGIFPMNYPVSHMILAGFFFIFTFSTISIFIFSLFLQSEPTIPKTFNFAGLFVVIIFAIFLLLPDWANYDSYMATRPYFWSVPFMEWIVFFSMNSYLLFISFYIQLQQKE